MPEYWNVDSPFSPKSQGHPISGWPIYIGGEVNAVMKNKEDVDIRFAMAFPDVCEIFSMSQYISAKSSCKGTLLMLR